MSQRRRISGFVCSAAACIAFGSIFVQNVAAQRLPDTVRPEHYSLILTPDLKSATFTGSEKIDVQVQKPIDSITLNAIEIKFQSVKTKLNGKTLDATVAEDPEKAAGYFQLSPATACRKVDAGN